MTKYRREIIITKYFVFIVATLTILFYISSTLIIQRMVPYGGRFPYKELLPDFGLPQWVSAWANFDGLHYIGIAKNGYSQYEQAFFPLYPLLIKLVAPVFFNNHLLAGLVISNLCLFIGLYFLLKTVAMLYKNSTVKWFLIYFLFFPTAFFFHAAYTESLFFLLFSGSLYFLKKKQLIGATLCAAFASATRLVGIFLIIPFFFELVCTAKQWNDKTIQKIIFIMSPLAGFSVYAFFLWKTTGNPFYFFSSQSAFGANRSTSLIFLPQVYYRYFRIFLISTHDLSYFVALTEFFLFTFSFFVSLWWTYQQYLSRKWFMLSIGLFSLINILLPTLTGTLSSVPRYALFSLAPLFYFSTLQSKLIRVIVALLFVVIHVVLLALFIQGYFVS